MDYKLIVLDFQMLFLRARDDRPDEEIAKNLQMVLSRQKTSRPVSDELRDRLSAKPFFSVFGVPSEYFERKFDSFKDWVWHNVAPKARQSERIASIPKIEDLQNLRDGKIHKLRMASDRSIDCKPRMPQFSTQQLICMKPIVLDWFKRNPIDFTQLRNAIEVERSVRAIDEKGNSDRRSNKSDENRRQAIL